MTIWIGSKQLRILFMNISQPKGWWYNIIAVNGCCYGRDSRPDKGDYYKYCGQRFWEFISGNVDLFTEIIEPLGYKAKDKNDVFVKSYSQMINKFTKEFAIAFCEDSGEINWDKLVRFNSAKEAPKKE